MTLPAPPWQSSLLIMLLPSNIKWRDKVFLQKKPIRKTNYHISDTTSAPLSIKRKQFSQYWKIWGWKKTFFRCRQWKIRNRAIFYKRQIQVDDKISVLHWTTKNVFASEAKHVSTSSLVWRRHTTTYHIYSKVNGCSRQSVCKMNVITSRQLNNSSFMRGMAIWEFDRESFTRFAISLTVSFNFLLQNFS